MSKPIPGLHYQRTTLEHGKAQDMNSLTHIHRRKSQQNIMNLKRTSQVKEGHPSDNQTFKNRCTKIKCSYVY